MLCCDRESTDISILSVNVSQKLIFHQWSGSSEHSFLNIEGAEIDPGAEHFALWWCSLCFRFCLWQALHFAWVLTCHYSGEVFHFVTDRSRDTTTWKRKTSAWYNWLTGLKHLGEDYRTRNNGLEKNKLGADLYSRRHFIACHSPSHWNIVTGWGKWTELLGASNGNLDYEVEETYHALPLPRTWLAYCGRNQGREYDPLVTGDTLGCVSYAHSHCGHCKSQILANFKVWILRSNY